MSERPASRDQALPAETVAPRSINPGQLQKFATGRYGLYRTSFEPRAAVRKEGGQLVFDGLVGKAQVWIDGRFAGEKPSVDSAAFAVELAPGSGQRSVEVVIEPPPGAPAGIAGEVTVESLE